jgi:hypothetical protein
METCANCEEQIGNMEPRAAWQGQIVCAACFERLAPAGQQAHVPAPIDPLDELASQLPVQRVQAYPTYPPGPQSPWPEPQQAAPNYNQQVIIHNYMGPQSRRRRSSGLKNSGVTLILISLPFLCVFWPVGVLVLAAGIVLSVIGSFE